MPFEKTARARADILVLEPTNPPTESGYEISSFPQFILRRLSVEINKTRLKDTRGSYVIVPDRMSRKRRPDYSQTCENSLCFPLRWYGSTGMCTCTKSRRKTRVSSEDTGWLYAENSFSRTCPFFLAQGRVVSVRSS